jgi:photosystem II stability/assembly factor-like uncharacterized protein
VINPLTPETLYAGTGYGRIFKSTNGGGNWSPAEAGLIANSVYALAIHPTLPTILYAGTDTGVFKTTESGAGWEAFNDGLTNLSVATLAINETPPPSMQGQRAAARLRCRTR